ncbi:hypothetical protein K493DRAFT_315662 [Basidiobolus meristosporus CBS 931.73]|uniref:HMG box domain-containing protein n=1 Tax=Basidiobolus meristosporus CBS 931.73 TaxID=1314790 RepID=A0A1Y1Y7W4_9FUNG|nr:hypothetical protein K493DRAFT_315662 [Basidiobolus meristosporus CBS 931.73]|eukprot:ORX94093.1 hypothetical protein K493DRAFT_315662 [Basidiobolus meristosporus CBS 931.73]
MSSKANVKSEPAEDSPSMTQRKTKGSKFSDIPLMSLEEANTPRKKRERKAVDRYEPGKEKTATPEPQKPIVHKGTGTKLSSIPRVASNISSRKNKDYTLYVLHRFLFGRLEGKPNVKEDLEAFNGFAFQNLEEEDVYWNKLEKWTLDTCKNVCEIFDLPFPNNKNDLHSSIMEFLKNPQIQDTVDTQQEESTFQISPFSFFVREKRGELIQNNPDKSLEDIQKELVSLWDSLPNDEKAVYQSRIPSEAATTKKRKYTKRGGKKSAPGAAQSTPGKRGRKAKSAHESLTKSKELVADSDSEEVN